MTSDFYKRPLFLILLVYAFVLSLFLPVPSPEKGDASFLASASERNIVVKADSYPFVRKDKTVFIGKILSVNGEKTKGRAHIYCKDCPTIVKGETLYAKGVLGEVFSDNNYGSFNWKEYLARRHIFSQIDASEAQSLQRAPLFWRGIPHIRAELV